MKNLFALLISLTFWLQGVSFAQTNSPIRPYQENPRYWEYKEQPVLLLGGSDDDNLFQWPKEMLVPHLDAMQAIGANYVRNTMSDRKDKGFELYPFRQLENGKYDLEQWNEVYWRRFEQFMEETHKREIIVQIEVWDRFDYSRENWGGHPYNPVNNINYSYEASGFEKEYPEHPNNNRQPFFFTTPNQQKNEAVLGFQQAFVKKMLSISLQYDHVLYCMDNETSAEEEWGAYWADFIKKEAGSKEIYLTEMWDDKHNLLGEQHLRTYDHPDRYNFVDISQNSWNQGFSNWENTEKVMSYIQSTPRPVNVKIYGNDASEASNPRSTEHAVQTFFRNILGGFASTRFHRPPQGLAMSEMSINDIKNISKIEEKVKMWEVESQIELLTDLSQNEAYVAEKAGEKYVVFFPQEV
jgi:hypothetical protein